MAAGPADKALDLFKDLVFDPLVKLAISRIIALAPWLSFGPISFIVGQVVTYVAGIVYEVMKDFINFEVILLRNAEHQKALIDALTALQKAAREKGTDSPEFRSLRESHKAALAKYARNPGT
jgi:hypothetical protein